MRLLSWNIQSTKGCDQTFDINRIIKEVKTFGELDVICLQEVSRNMQAYNNDDQKALFEAAFPHHISSWGAGFSRPLADGKRQEFGNLTLTKKGLLLDQRIHQLPNPCVSPAIQIPRVVTESVISHGDRRIAILNTHLAYHSEKESKQQIEHLTQLRDQILSHKARPINKAPTTENDAYHSAQQGQSVVLCGDLNIAMESPRYKNLTQQMAWLDCAQHLSSTCEEITLKPTCGVHDKELWPQGPHIRDYFLSSADLQDKLENVEVNTLTTASDHQPICLTLKD